VDSLEHDNVTFLGRTNFREQHQLFGIRQSDRLHHMLLLGKTGTGKSTLLEFMAQQDIEDGQGLVLFDPHGDLVSKLASDVPPGRRKDLLYWNVPDTAQPVGFNPIERVPAQLRALAASSLMEAFGHQWASSWGPRLEHVLRNSILALLEQPEATLVDILRLLHDHEYRRQAALRVAHEPVRKFWLEEFESYPARFRAEVIAPVENKVGAFLSNPILYHIFSQRQSAFDLREIMDSGKILLVNLAKGKIGAESAMLFGALLLAQIQTTALSRADTPTQRRRNFFVYLDEFPSYTTSGLAGMLSELRKFGVGLVLANQHLSQMPPEVREAVLGNVGTQVCFRTGFVDAELLAKEFGPELSAADLICLPNHEVYVRLMVEGIVSRPFSAKTCEGECIGCQDIQND
jgi:hypothetical protein